MYLNNSKTPHLFGDITLPTLDKEKGSNRADFYCADVLGGKKFAQNFAGYPRSDVAQINAQSDLSVAKAMIERLTDYSSDTNPTKGLSDTEIMMAHRSKYTQSASETIRYVENQLSRRDAKLEQIRLDKIKAAELSMAPAVKSDAEIVDNV